MKALESPLIQKSKEVPNPNVTFVKSIQGFQYAPPEGCQGVLDAGAQAQHALQVWLAQHLLPVGRQVRRAAQQRRHVVHKFGHQASVGIVRLAVMVCHYLQGATEEEGGTGS